MTAVAEGLKAGRTLSKANESSIRSALEGISAAKEALETVLPAKADDDENDDPEEDPEGDDNPDDTPPNGDDEDDDPKGGVSSESTQGVSSGNGPSLGESELKALAEMIGGAVAETLAEVLGIKTPPSKTSLNPSDPLVTEIQLMELGSPE